MSATVKSHVRGPPLAAQQSLKGLTESSNATVFTVILELCIYTHPHRSFFSKSEKWFYGWEWGESSLREAESELLLEGQSDKEEAGKIGSGRRERSFQEKQEKCPERELDGVGYVPGLCSNLSLGCPCEHDRCCPWRVC